MFEAPLSKKTIKCQWLFYSSFNPMRPDASSALVESAILNPKKKILPRMKLSIVYIRRSTLSLIEATFKLGSTQLGFGFGLTDTSLNPANPALSLKND